MFAQQVDHKLLPEAVFNDFGLIYAPPKPQSFEIDTIVEQQQKAKTIKIFSTARALIENTVTFFQKNDLAQTVVCLTRDGEHRIKKDLSTILQRYFPEKNVGDIVLEVEEHLKNVVDKEYDQSKIALLVDLLEIIKKNGFQ